MLEYEWGGNPSIMILPTPGDEPTDHHHHQDNGQSNQPDRHQYFHPSNTNPFNHQEGFIPAAATLYQQQPSPSPHHHNHQVHVSPFYDPRAYTMAPTPSFLSLDHHPLSAPPPSGHSSSSSGYFLIPKAEEQTQTTGAGDHFASRIGLNLGGRTYFSSAEDDFVNRLYRRSRPLMMDHAGSSAAAVAARCQAEGCNADLTHAKHYHRRHKVCEFHSKASTVVAHGFTQRFCQQCSRFHLLSEFDNGKRSCRKRLADHNRRRRKSNSQTTVGANHQDISGRHCNSPPPPLQPESARNSPSDHLTRSPPDSGVHSPSSVNVALSPPPMSLDCFKQMPYHQASNNATITTSASSSASSSSFFFSSG